VTEKGFDMENVLIRECTRADIDAILQLERQWEIVSPIPALKAP